MSYPAAVYPEERPGPQPALQVVKSYNRSIHGKLVQLGSSEAADCLSCHASSALHDIYPEDNPRATISEANIADTCQRCHQSTNRWFIQIAVHPGIQPEENRIVAGASLFFRVALYGTVFGLLGLMLCETFGRRKEGVGLLLNNGTLWRRKSRSRNDKRPAGADDRPGNGRLDHPLGPFYGTSYDPETGSLSEGKNLIARIAPFVSPAAEDGFRPAILPQDAPLARDYMQVRDQLSPEQREAVKNEFHKKIKPQGHDCKRCHSENSILDFQQLGFTENRALILKNLTIVDMLPKYEEFHTPEFIDESLTGR